MARRVVIAPRVQIGPVTDFVTPGFAIDPGEREWLATLNPNRDEPTVQWKIVLEVFLPSDGQWRFWRSFQGTGIVFNDEKQTYPGIGGTFPGDPDPWFPTEVRGRITLNEQILCGLLADTP